MDRRARSHWPYGLSGVLLVGCLQGGASESGSVVQNPSPAVDTASDASDIEDADSSDAEGVPMQLAAPATPRLLPAPHGAQAAVAPPREPRGRSAGPTIAAWIGPGRILPRAMLGGYAECIEAIDAGRESCQLGHPDIFGPLLLGGSYAGWFVDISTPRSAHVFRLVDPSNRRAFVLGRIGASRLCGEIGDRTVFRPTKEVELPGGRVREIPAEAGWGSPLAAHIDARSIRITFHEIFEGCGGCASCQCVGLFSGEPRTERFAIPLRATAWLTRTEGLRGR